MTDTLAPIESGPVGEGGRFALDHRFRAAQALADEPRVRRGARRTDGGFTDETFARLVGCHRVTVQKWRRRGIPPYTADRAACRLGLHPCLVWGDAWWAAVPIDNQENP